MTTLRRAVLASGLLLGCARGPGVGDLEPYDRPGLLLRHRSPDILCATHIHASGHEDDLDRLEPDEVIPPGGSRFFPLAPGAHDVALLDCNGVVVMHREEVQVADEGAMLTYEERN